MGIEQIRSKNWRLPPIFLMRVFHKIPGKKYRGDPNIVLVQYIGDLKSDSVFDI